MYVRKEAVLSSQIEGTQATLMDVLEFEAKALEPDRPQDADEVINYVNALNYGLSRLQKLPVSSRLFREAHGKLMPGVPVSRKTRGDIRRTRTCVGPPGSSIAPATCGP